MHAVWSPGTNAALAERGFDFLAAYVCGRAAPLGAVPSAVVAAAFARVRARAGRRAVDGGPRALGLEELIEVRDRATGGQPARGARARWRRSRGGARWPRCWRTRSRASTRPAGCCSPRCAPQPAARRPVRAAVARGRRRARAPRRLARRGLRGGRSGPGADGRAVRGVGRLPGGRVQRHPGVAGRAPGGRGGRGWRPTGCSPTGGSPRPAGASGTASRRRPTPRRRRWSPRVGRAIGPGDRAARRLVAALRGGRRVPAGHPQARRGLRGL